MQTLWQTAHIYFRLRLRYKHLERNLHYYAYKPQKEKVQARVTEGHILSGICSILKGNSDVID